MISHLIKLVFSVLWLGFYTCFIVGQTWLFWKMIKVMFGGLIGKCGKNRKAFGKNVRKIHYDPNDNDFAEGIRFALLCLVNNKVMLRAYVQNETFPALDAQAICVVGKEHDAPDESCRCGFYSAHSYLKLRFLLIPYARLNECLLEVRLSKKLIEGSRGLRAKRQDVLKVWLPSRCASRWCRQEAQFMILSEKSFSEPGSLLPACYRHTKGKSFLTAPDIATQLQTEVEWAYTPG